MLKMVGSIAVVVGSFFVTLVAIDYFSPTISVIEATYGANCKAKRGNLTAYFSKACDQNPKCSGVIDVGRVGDPAPGCVKDFFIKYSCGRSSSFLEVSIPPEANGKVFDLTCQERQ